MRHTFFDAFFSDLFDKNNIIDSRFQVFLRNLIGALINNNPDEAFNEHSIHLLNTLFYISYFILHNPSLLFSNSTFNSQFSFPFMP